MTWLGPVIALVVGALLAAGASLGLVASQSATPAVVDKPFVVYGTTS